MFVYEKWQVYQDALALRRLVRRICRAAGRGLGSDINQLRRAASSIVFNIAEGAGHYSPGKKIELYRVALGSAHECNSILAVLEHDMPSSKLISEAQDLCNSISAQLTNLIRSIDERSEATDETSES